MLFGPTKSSVVIPRSLLLLPCCTKTLHHSVLQGRLTRPAYGISYSQERKEGCNAVGRRQLVFRRSTPLTKRKKIMKTLWIYKQRICNWCQIQRAHIRHRSRIPDRHLATPPADRPQVTFSRVISADQVCIPSSYTPAAKPSSPLWCLGVTFTNAYSYRIGMAESPVCDSCEWRRNHRAPIVYVPLL
ncbi:uncharacterized protein [Dermacentor albipictus]|uniref:uncharacterized protein n=1 Tax=Dermacentor albipictus TaxID=60249 RepID=UPI0031FBCFDB